MIPIEEVKKDCRTYPGIYMNSLVEGLLKEYDDDIGKVLAILCHITTNHDRVKMKKE